ncbi:MAG: HAD family hydrolase [Lachnospiraceae bacterium]|nr:HAD family hydrolase [Butyrivibrio sp.]MCM1342383.1 HAD family hydrolase [Muribaculaceae bacterium]MCM1409276.1 HAD family hydrolase [Lachnospiraceae bacterium]
MSRTLYVTDLDGTLLNKRSRIDPKSIQVINGLVKQGMLFSYATARSVVSAAVVTQGLSTDIPVITHNGTFIINLSTGEILSKESFAPEETDRIVEVLEKFGIGTLVYAHVEGVEKVSWLVERENDGIRHYLSQRKGDRRLRPVSTREELYQGDMFYFTCVGGQEELRPVYDVFSKDGRFRCIMQQELYSPEYFCEIMPARATKAEAVLKLKKIWDCDRVVSFGDAVNDIPMFEISDECYAVGNAVDELKAVATGVIGSNEEDGVAVWLERNARI